MEYTATTVVEKERKKSGIGGVLGSDRVLVMVVGRVQVGVDLTEITRRDVEIEGTAIELLLPPAEIVSVELLPDQSRVYESDRSWLFSEYDGLEIEAMEEARTQLMTPNPGMLELAETLARLQLQEFLQKIGYQEITVRFRDQGD